MKRDYSLYRLILRQVRDDTPPPELSDFDERMVTYNSALLVNEHFIEGEVIRNGSGEYASVVMLNLTSEGHDLLEKLDADHRANATTDLSDIHKPAP